MAEQVVPIESVRLHFQRTRARIGGLDDKVLDEALQITATAFGISVDAARQAVIENGDPSPEASHG